MQDPFFDRLVWSDDRVVLDDLQFVLEQAIVDGQELGEECFRLHKLKELVDQYERFWRHHDLHPQAILEIGMWDGGSVAFWNVCFSPQKHVGVDIQQRPDSEFFQQFVR